MDKKNPPEKRPHLEGSFCTVLGGTSQPTEKRTRPGFEPETPRPQHGVLPMTLPCLCFLKIHPRPDSNWRPTDQASNALPTELRGCWWPVQTTRW